VVKELAKHRATIALDKMPRAEKGVEAERSAVHWAFLHAQEKKEQWYSKEIAKLKRGHFSREMSAREVLRSRKDIMADEKKLQSVRDASVGPVDIWLIVKRVKGAFSCRQFVYFSDGDRYVLSRQDKPAQPLELAKSACSVWPTAAAGGAFEPFGRNEPDVVADYLATVDSWITFLSQPGLKLERGEGVLKKRLTHLRTALATPKLTESIPLFDKKCAMVEYGKAVHAIEERTGQKAAKPVAEIKPRAPETKEKGRKTAGKKRERDGPEVLDPDLQRILQELGE
jgi:hypothetical protein